MSKPYGVIYCITNLVNGKYYIGQTVQTAEKRFYQHWYQPKRQKVFNRMHTALKKYGRHAFEVQVLAEASSAEELDRLETLWILATNSTDKHVGYNLKTASRGVVYSDEARQRMSDAAKRRLSDPDSLAKHKRINVGRTPSAETVKRISETSKARWQQPEYRERYTAANKGRKLSEETKKRQAAASKLRWANPEYKAKMAEAVKARWNNPDERAKQGELSRLRWSDPEYKSRLSLAAKAYSAAKRAMEVQQDEQAT